MIIIILAAARDCFSPNGRHPKIKVHVAYVLKSADESNGGTTLFVQLPAHCIRIGEFVLFEACFFDPLKGMSISD